LLSFTWKKGEGQEEKEKKKIRRKKQTKQTYQVKHVIAQLHHQLTGQKVSVLLVNNQKVQNPPEGLFWEREITVGEGTAEGLRVTHDQLGERNVIFFLLFPSTARPQVNFTFN